MKLSLSLLMATTTVPSIYARLPLYRLDNGAASSLRKNNNYNNNVDSQLWRQLEAESAIEEMSMPEDTDLSMPFGDTIMSMPDCSTYDSCPAAGTCECGGRVEDGGAICDCYDIEAVDPPFDDDIAYPATGSWYCFEATLDKTKDGCGGAKAISHAVLATGFPDHCTFHAGGQVAGGADDWGFQTCDNTAATGLKFDFGQSGSGSQLSVTYCFDVSCEDSPAGEGTATWVLKSGNDRCEIAVPGGPNCGVTADEDCHPSCPAGADVIVDDAATTPACDGSSGSIGEQGSFTADLSVSLQVETTGSGTDFTQELAEGVLEIAASANSLCGSSSEERARFLAAAITGIQLVDASVSATETCEAQEADNTCHVVDVELELSGKNPSVNQATGSTMTAISDSTDSLVGGDIVRVSVDDGSSAAVTNDASNASPSGSDKNKRTIILATVFAVTGTVAAVAFVYRKVASQRKASGDDASSSASSSGDSSSAGVPSVL